MRITGGLLAGRIIKCPDGVIRPAMDRMRESVFAALGGLSGMSWLDLFSGSGSVAIEAASRGAATVELCEKDRVKIPALLENVAMAERETGVKIRCHFMPAEYFIRRCRRRFDYIFLDPPFPYHFHEELVARIGGREILSPEGTVLVHRPEERAMPDNIGTLRKRDERAYGRSVVDFYSYGDFAAAFD